MANHVYAIQTEQAKVAIQNIKGLKSHNIFVNFAERSPQALQI
jgi:hypothetical protein